MALKRSIRNREIIAMLGQLRYIDSGYPPELYSKRRAAFLALLALPAFLPGSAPTVPLGEVHAAHATMSFGLKVALVAASTIVIGVSAFLGIIDREQREAIVNWLAGGAPTPALVTPLAQSPLSVSPTVTALPTLTVSSPSSTPTPTVIATGTQTPSPTLSPTAVWTATNESPPQSKATATLEPTNPGLHLGQTKTPRPK